MSLAYWEVRCLGLARALFGVLLLVRTTPLLALVCGTCFEDTWPLFGWPSLRWHFAAFDFALPPLVVAAACVLRTLAAVAFALGLRTREAGLAAGALGYVVLAQDALGFFNSIHLLYAGTILLALAGSGGALALRAKTPISPDSGVALIRAFAASVYAWSGLAKLNANWLNGTSLARLHEEHVVSGQLADWVLARHSGTLVCSWGIAALEIALGPLLFWRPTRRAAFVGALLFHALIECVVHPDVFGFAMAALLVTFWDPRGSMVSGQQQGLRRFSHSRDHVIAAADAASE